MLIFSEHILKKRKKSIIEIDFFPDYVLEQLFNLTPCKDLAAGFSELDAEKFDMHIIRTKKAIGAAK